MDVDERDRWVIASAIAAVPSPFTWRLHEAVAGEMLVKDTFRRRMQHQLTETGDIREGVVGKPARLWVRRA